EPVAEFGNGRTNRLPAFVLGVAALTLCFVTQIIQLFPSLEGLQIAKFLTVLVVLSFVLSRDGFRSRVAVRSVPQFISLFGLLGLAVVTIPSSLWPSNSLDFVTGVFAKNVAFVYLLLQAARTDRASRFITRTFVAGCSTLVIAMICGFGPLVTYRDHPDRLAVGGTYDANDLALLFVVAIPFAFFQVRSSRPVTRALLITAIALMLGGILVTGSRGGFLGLLAIAALILIKSRAQARKYALVAISAGALLFAFAAPATYWNRINTIVNYEEDYNLTERSGRVEVWKTGARIFSAHPLLGVGIANFPVAHSKYSETHAEIAAHNSFLQVGAELGLPGLLLFVWGIAATFLATRRIRRRSAESDESAWLASAVEVSLAGFLAAAFFLSHAYSAIFCFLVGMGGVLLIQRRLKSRIEEQSREEIEYA
ncbi:MAG TPA: O-antigen ligase family protein, partial [Blastocatellia bacterium]|nr:O-antigen ligase family protein [Blastocatellia bacterium]